MIQRLSFAAVILALIFSSFSCAPSLEKPTPTPIPEEATPPPRELASTGDFSVAIASVQREEDKAILRFGITKVGDTNAGAQILPVTLIDDHGNEYKGELGIDLGLKEISEAQREVENTFYSDPEEEFYMLPQEMVLTLPGSYPTYG